LLPPDEWTRGVYALRQLLIHGTFLLVYSQTTT